MNYELLLRAVFSCFHGQKFNLNSFYIVASELKSCYLDTKVKKVFKKFGRYCGEGVNNCFFLGLAVLVIVYPLLFPLISLPPF